MANRKSKGPDMAQNQAIDHYASYQGREPVACIVRKNGRAIRLYDTTDNAAFQVTYASFETDETDGTPIIAETSTGVTIEPSRTITYDATTGKLKLFEHGLERDDEILYTSTGSPFGSLVSGQRYFVRDVDNHYFNVALTQGGTTITLGAEGSATHSIKVVGHVVYTPQSNVAYPATGTQYGCFFVANSGTNTFARSRFPEHPNQNNGGMIRILVK